LKHPLKEIISADQIQKRVKELAVEISKDFRGKNLTLIGVLEGASRFMKDLIREIQIPHRCDFIKMKSYDENGKSGRLHLEKDVSHSLEKQHVLLVEDILDSGKTLRFLFSHLDKKNPESLSVCCLLDKGFDPQLSSQIKYSGFKAPAGYLVGYGLDLDGLYRELPYIAETHLQITS